MIILEILPSFMDTHTVHTSCNKLTFCPFSHYILSVKFSGSFNIFSSLIFLVSTSLDVTLQSEKEEYIYIQ